MELITIFHKDNPDVAISLERYSFYENRRTTYKDHYLYVVDVFLFNSCGEILLQKRSRRKKKSPGKFHTTIGGHVSFGEDPMFTLVHETFEEIGTGCYATPKDKDFGKTLEKLGSYADQIALIYPIKDYFRTLDNYQDPSGEMFSCKDRVFLCFGLYNGGFKSVDRSSDGCEWFSVEDLYSIRKEFPQLFTGILHSYLDELKVEITEFVKLIKTK